MAVFVGERDKQRRNGLQVGVTVQNSRTRYFLPALNNAKLNLVIAIDIADLNFPVFPALVVEVRIALEDRKLRVESDGGKRLPLRLSLDYP